MKSVKVGICGLGTVGGGAFNVLRRNAEEIARRTGRGIEVTQIAVRRPDPRYGTGATPVTADIFDIACNSEIDVVVELTGGCTLAHELVLKVIKNSKHMVTANRVLVTVHSNGIFTKARRKGIIIAFGAAVASGIPVIEAIHEGLSASRINWLVGIINSTGNFILSEMREKGRTFPDVLAEAQALGHTEADPTLDVEDIDVTHKLTILTSITFGIPPQFDKTYTEDVLKLTDADVNYTDALGYRIRHLGVARYTESGFELRVHPTLIPSDRLIANVNGMMSVVMVNGDAVGSTLYYDAGAGTEPTISSVVVDLVNMVRAMTFDSENRVPHLAFQPDTLSDHPTPLIRACGSTYYLRIRAKGHPGVLARVAAILSEHDISIGSIMQEKAEEQDGLVSMILVTHRVIEQRINDAVAALEALESVSGPVVHIRVEQLN